MDEKILTKLEKLEINTDELQQTVATLQKAVLSIVANMVTKDDAKHFLTKDDAKHFLTKDDAKHFLTKDDAKHFLTKDDAKNFATKDDLKDLVTKDYLDQRLDKQTEIICEDIGEVVNALFVETDKLKADRKDLVTLENKVDTIKQALSL